MQIIGMPVKIDIRKYENNSNSEKAIALITDYDETSNGTFITFTLVKLCNDFKKLIERTSRNNKENLISVNKIPITNKIDHFFPNLSLNDILENKNKIVRNIEFLCVEPKKEAL